MFSDEESGSPIKSEKSTSVDSLDACFDDVDFDRLEKVINGVSNGNHQNGLAKELKDGENGEE